MHNSADINPLCLQLGELVETAIYLGSVNILFPILNYICLCKGQI